jgi:endonuclease/exonuclease/phosphatase family metal-dependent hydrolase
MKTIIKIIKYLALIIAVLLGLLTILIYSTTFHPKPIQDASITCPSDAPLINPTTPLKVMSYNIQYLAGKDYIFYYDIADEAGPDLRPSSSAITATLERISELILEEDPDILLLQEVHEGAKQTDYEDQTERLLSKFENKYPCYSEAFYWKAKFVPHPSIMGSVGMKLVTFSKYQIAESHRHQLAQTNYDPVTDAFNLKRAVLVSELPMSNGKKLVAMNAHLDAFSQGYDTIDRQVVQLSSLLETTAEPWVLGGDFNLLPPNQYNELSESQQIWYNPETEITPLMTAFTSVPSIENTNSDERSLWFTFYANDTQVNGPDRTLDYLFYDSNLTLQNSRVIQGDALKNSDHMPVVATFVLPK